MKYADRGVYKGGLLGLITPPPRILGVINSNNPPPSIYAFVRIFYRIRILTTGSRFYGTVLRWILAYV